MVNFSVVSQGCRRCWWHDRWPNAGCVCRVEVGYIAPSRDACSRLLARLATPDRLVEWWPARVSRLVAWWK